MLVFQGILNLFPEIQKLQNLHCIYRTSVNVTMLLCPRVLSSVKPLFRGHEWELCSSRIWMTFNADTLTLKNIIFLLKSLKTWNMRLSNPEIKTTTDSVSCSPFLMSINHNFNWCQLKTEGVFDVFDWGKFHWLMTRTFNYKLSINRLSETHPRPQHWPLDLHETDL